MAGITGFGTAIAIHPIVGYNSVSHLGPAVVAAMIFLIGLVLCYKPMTSGTAPASRNTETIDGGNDLALIDISSR